MSQACRGVGEVHAHTTDKQPESYFTLWFSFVAPSRVAPVYMEQKSYKPGKTGLWNENENCNIQYTPWMLMDWKFLNGFNTVRCISCLTMG